MEAKYEILASLKESEGYVSGEEISRPLKVSRAGVWKYIQELRKEGYDIVAVPHLGYRLISSPDRLLPIEIRHNLRTRFLGKNIIHYDTVTSTMEHAFRMGMEGAPEGTVVCAETQTQGRGRLGRSWVSPKGKGIYMSVLLRPRLLPSDAAQLTLLSAVAVCEAVYAVSGVKAAIKWPNDVLIGGRKLAGILTELSAETDRVRFVVVGIGVNVHSPVNLLPANAASLKEEASKKVSRVELVQEILRQMEYWYESSKKEGFAPALERWKELSSTLGRRIRVVDPGGVVEGEAVGLDKGGRLLIRSDAGLIVSRTTGDVVQVR